MKALFLTVLVVAWSSAAAAQGRGAPTQPPAQPGQAPAQPARPRPAPKPVAPRVTVRDQRGIIVPGVKITLSGPATAELVTDEAGVSTLPALKDGNYRLRFDHEGFFTLEREFTVRAPQPAAIEVTINHAPPPPPAPTPPPAPKPPAPPPVPPSGPPVTIAIPDYVDKNFVGRDPLKESVLACNGLETVRLLQLRDPIAEHNHSNLDEVLYVVAGEGTVHLGSIQSNVSAGALVVVPHGTPHSIDRRGRNPLILLSTLSGAPCPNMK